MRRPPSSARTTHACPYTTLFRSVGADDVEQPDQAERPGADIGAEPLVDDEGRQMRGDEGDVKAADEEARIQEPETEAHTSELQSLMRISYAVFGWQKK